MKLPIKHALKTAMAAVAAMLAARALGITDGSWAVISAVIVMQVNLGSSLSASRSRILGTTIGAVVGAGVVWLLGVTPWSVGVALIVTILLCSSLQLEDGYRLAAATTAIIMLAEGPDVWSVGFSRFVSVILGIVAAVAVSMLVWPSRAGDHLRRGLAEVLESCARLYRLLIDAHLSGRYSQEAVEELRRRIKRTFRENRDLLKDCEQEPRGAAELHALVAFTGSVEHLIEHVLAMDEETQREEGRVARAEKNLPRRFGAAGCDDVPGWAGEITEQEQTGQESRTLYGDLAQQAEPLARATEAAFRSLAAQLRREPADHAEQPHLEAAQAAFDDQVALLRKAGRFRTHGLDDVLNFFSFVHGMKRAARDAAILTEKAAALRQP